MPSYTARNKKNGKFKEFQCTISEMEEFEKKNPDWEVLPVKPFTMGYNCYSIKPDEGFRDLLREIKKKHKGSTINIR